MISLFSVQNDADEPLVRRGDPDGISEVHFLSLILYLGDFIGKTNLRLFNNNNIVFVFVMDLYLH